MNNKLKIKSDITKGENDNLDYGSYDDPGKKIIKNKCIYDFNDNFYENVQGPIANYMFYLNNLKYSYDDIVEIANKIIKNIKSHATLLFDIVGIGYKYCPDGIYCLNMNKYDYERCNKYIISNEMLLYNINLVDKFLIPKLELFKSKMGESKNKEINKIIHFLNRKNSIMYDNTYMDDFLDCFLDMLKSRNTYLNISEYFVYDEDLVDLITNLNHNRPINYWEFVHYSKLKTPNRLSEIRLFGIQYKINIIFGEEIGSYMQQILGCCVGKTVNNNKIHVICGLASVEKQYIYDIMYSVLLNKFKFISPDCINKNINYDDIKFLVIDGINQHQLNNINNFDDYNYCFSKYGGKLFIFIDDFMKFNHRYQNNFVIINKKHNRFKLSEDSVFEINKKNISEFNKWLFEGYENCNNGITVEPRNHLKQYKTTLKLFYDFPELTKGDTPENI